MDYPWPHILSYRAWLLCDNEETASAERQLESAIDICMNENHGPTLRWIAEVLRTFAQALGLSLSETPSEKTRMQLRNDLEKAPHSFLNIFAERSASQHLDNEQILRHLDSCLPFNFH